MSVWVCLSKRGVDPAYRGPVAPEDGTRVAKLPFSKFSDIPDPQGYLLRIKIFYQRYNKFA